MWQDNQTTAKWVTVNQCYFPSDLPETVGRPCGLESSEVKYCLVCCICWSQIINWEQRFCAVPVITSFACDFAGLWVNL